LETALREYWVDKGKLRGYYNIYDSPQEFMEKNPGVELYRWGQKLPEDMKIGDWVRAHDDYVCQVLKIIRMVSPNQVTHFVRFPMSTVAVKKYKEKVRFYEFYAMFTPFMKDSMKRMNVEEYKKRNLTERIKFAGLILAGVNPIAAYKDCFGPKIVTLHHILYKIKLLLKDEMVGQIIMDKFTEISQKINTEITDEQFVEKIVEHWKKVKPGDKLFIPTVKFVGELTGKLTPQVKKLKNIEEAQLLEEDPPELLP
jgi:hypothetical protein